MAKTPMEQIGVDLPEEPEVVVQQDNPPEPVENVVDERPDWLPSKFKEPEQLVKSYTELESKLGEQGRTISDLEKRLTEMSESQQYEQFWQPDEDYFDQLYTENPREAVRQEVTSILTEMQRQAYQANQQYAQQQAPLYEAQKATNAEMIARFAEESVAGRYDDYPEHAERAKEILQGRDIPDHELQNLPQFERHLDEAYRLARYEAMVGQEQELRDQGISQQEIDRLRKEQAQTLTARRSAPHEQLEPEQQKALELIAARQQAGKPPWY